MSATPRFLVIAVVLAACAYPGMACAQPTDAEGSGTNSSPDSDAPSENTTPSGTPNAVGIIIRSALYGPQNLAASCSALRAVRIACQGRLRCSVSVSEKICDFDSKPAPSLFPALTVSYRCTESQPLQERIVERPFVLRLSCVPKV
jgi:hypothetical protein